MERETSVYNLLSRPTRRESRFKDPPDVARLEVRYGDLDPYGHVNNAVYLEFFEEIRLSYWRALADLAGIKSSRPATSQAPAT